MKGTGDIWEALGELTDEEAHQVLARLFADFERLAGVSPEDPAAEQFFRRLANALEVTGGCNLNRR